MSNVTFAGVEMIKSQKPGKQAPYRVMASERPLSAPSKKQILMRI